MAKSIETECMCHKTEMTKEWNGNFLQNSLWGIQHIYCREFFIG